MKKVVVLLAVVSLIGITDANAGYYRNKNSFTGTYQSTGRTNNLGTHRAPAGYHTTSYGIVQKNSIW